MPNGRGPPTWYGFIMTGRVAVAMSGGVDSTVAALLLKRAGYHLIGVFMHNWDEQDEGGGAGCAWEADYSVVREVCERLDIPCQKVDLIKEYWNDVFGHLLDEMAHGLTPNPDVVCNQKIKFSTFFKHITNTMGIVTMATGHYARVETCESGVARLLQAIDTDKDQTYFLSQIPQSALRQTMFPIGHLKKPQVRRIASEAGFNHIAEKKESTGLCFIGKRKFSRFISEYLEERPGPFVSLDGRVLGQHKGHHFFTIGQRARISGQPVAYFVASKDHTSNTVTVVQGSTHQALYTHTFTTSQPHWITQRSPDPLRNSYEQTLECLVRIRHQQPMMRCTITTTHSGGLLVFCEEPIRAVTPGQYAVFYVNEECLGGACILTPGPSLWQPNQYFY